MSPAKIAALRALSHEERLAAFAEDGSLIDELLNEAELLPACEAALAAIDARIGAEAVLAKRLRAEIAKARR